MAAQAAGTSPMDVITAYDVVGTVQVPVMVVSLVVACLWLQGSRQIAKTVAPGFRHKRRPVWVWLGWIVPVVSFWFPYQVVRDVCSGSGVRLRSTLGPWWACWLVAQWLTNQATLASMGAGSRDPSMVPPLEVVVTAATVVAFVLWVRIVLAVTSTQKAQQAGLRSS